MDSRKKKPAPLKEVEQPVKGAPAVPNRNPQVSRLPGSNFEAYDSLGSSNPPDGKSQGPLNWNDDYLETPTYLRKNAN